MAFDTNNLEGKAVRILRLPTVDYTGTPRQVVQAQEGDINSRYIGIELYDDRGVINLSVYDEYFFTVQLVGGEKKYLLAEIDSNMIYCKLTQLMLMERGTLQCDITLRGVDKNGNETSLTSQTFYISIAQSFFDETVPVDDGDLITLKSLIDLVNSLEVSISREELARNSNESIRILNEEVRQRSYSESQTLANSALEKANEVLQRANDGLFDGETVFIRYSENQEGIGMTETWMPGQKYIGVFLGHSPSEEPNDYNWLLFVGGSLCLTDTSSSNVNYILEDNTDKTFSSNNIISMNLTIPSVVYHGFYAGVNFKTRSAAGTSLNFINSSGFPLILLNRGKRVDSYVLSTGKTIMLIMTCDGLNVYCNMIEV